VSAAGISSRFLNVCNVATAFREVPRGWRPEALTGPVPSTYELEPVGHFLTLHSVYIYSIHASTTNSQQLTPIAEARGTFAARIEWRQAIHVAYHITFEWLLMRSQAAAFRSLDVFIMLLAYVVREEKMWHNRKYLMEL